MANNNKEEFDPIAWANLNNNNQVQAPVASSDVHVVSNSDQNDDIGTQVSKITDMLVSRGCDITAGYDNWLKLGFALADGLDESGRTFYHVLSRMNSDYNPAECDKQYNACLHSNGHGITINTFFHMAKEAGIDLSAMAREACMADNFSVNTAHVVATVASAAAQQPTGDESLSPELIEKFKQCEVKMDTVYPPNEFLFTVYGVPVITRGDIHTIGAKQKGGKSSLVAIFMAAVLRGQWDCVKCIMDDAKVLYIDTEMKPVDTQMLAEKAAKMAGVDKSAVSEKIHLVNFRPLSPKEMEDGIRYFINQYKPTIVYIDGIVDLCTNFNDVEASQNLVLNFLMKISEENKCAIVNVLHTNKTDNYVELRGHLGAFCEQKGSTVIKCEKDDAHNLVTVKFPTHRYAPVPEFHFTFDGNGIPVSGTSLHNSIEEEKKRTAEEQKAEKKKAEYDKRSAAVVDILQKNGGRMKRKELTDRVGEVLKLGNSTVAAHIKEMLLCQSSVISEEKPEIILN